jgi:hypothetical protein
MNPMPPKIWVASRELSMAASLETSFAMAASFLNGRPASTRRAASCQARREVYTRACIWAIVKAMYWCEAIGTPKTLRVFA